MGHKKIETDAGFPIENAKDEQPATGEGEGGEGLLIFFFGGGKEKRNSFPTNTERTKEGEKGGGKIHNPYVKRIFLYLPENEALSKMAFP